MIKALILIIAISTVIGYDLFGVAYNSYCGAEKLPVICAIK